MTEDSKSSCKKVVKRLIRERPKLPSLDVSELVEKKSSRYPKRCARVNYEDAEVPDDDHYLCELEGCFLSLIS